MHELKSKVERREKNLRTTTRTPINQNFSYLSATLSMFGSRRLFKLLSSLLWTQFVVASCTSICQFWLWIYYLLLVNFLYLPTMISQKSHCHWGHRTESINCEREAKELILVALLMGVGSTKNKLRCEDDKKIGVRVRCNC